MAGDWHRLPRRVRALQRGLWCIGNRLCMGLLLELARRPTPRGRDSTHDGLAAGMNVNVLDGHLLLTLAAVAIECVRQCRKAAGQLVRLVQVLPASLECLFANHGAPVA